MLARRGKEAGSEGLEEQLRWRIFYERRRLFYLDEWRRWRIQNRVQSSEQKATGTPVPFAWGSPLAKSIVIDYRARKLLVTRSIDLEASRGPRCPRDDRASPVFCTFIRCKRGMDKRCLGLEWSWLLPPNTPSPQKRKKIRTIFVKRCDNSPNPPCN